MMACSIKFAKRRIKLHQLMARRRNYLNKSNNKNLKKKKSLKLEVQRYTSFIKKWPNKHGRKIFLALRENSDFYGGRFELPEHSRSSKFTYCINVAAYQSTQFPTTSGLWILTTISGWFFQPQDRLRFKSQISANHCIRDKGVNFFCVEWGDLNIN